MRPLKPTMILSLVLAIVLHVDWHLARPEHHRLSLGWPHHWIATAVVFALVGCLIARRWPEHRWRMGLVVVALAVVLAQLVEPLLEVLAYEGRFGYDVEPERWAAFWRAIGAGVPALALGLLCARRPRSIGAA